GERNGRSPRPARGAGEDAAGRRARRRGADRPGNRQVRGTIRYHGRGRPLSRPPRTLEDAQRRAGTVRAEARFPAAGDEPGGEHGRVEGRGTGRVGTDRVAEGGT